MGRAANRKWAKRNAEQRTRTRSTTALLDKARRRKLFQGHPKFKP